MASGFIEIEQDKVFAPRWTAFDEVVRLIIRELNTFDNLEAPELIKTLSHYVPSANVKDNMEVGWGFYDPVKDDMISRNIELWKFPTEQQSLFWNAATNMYDKILSQGKSYTLLYPEVVKPLFELKKITNANKV